MDLGSWQGGGIVGTPIENSTTSGRFKISAADKIAPTREIYLKRREHDAVRRDRNLINKASQSAVQAENLYRTSKRSSLSVEDIIDDEDRANFRLLEAIKGRENLKRAQDEVSGTSPGVARSLFAVASADTPEVLPKARQSSFGDALLSRRLDGRARLEGHEKSWQLYKMNNYLTFVSAPNGNCRGLGYIETQRTEAEGLKTTSLRTSSAAESAIRTRRVVNSESLRPDTLNEFESDDDMEQLANFGYRGLDDAAQRLQQKLEREDARASNRSRQIHKRSRYESHANEQDRVLFTTFAYDDVESEDVEHDRHRELLVPSAFMSNPVHKFEQDRFRKEGALLLPSELQEEYKTIVAMNLALLKSQGLTTNASIDRASKLKDERLRNIRQQFLEDLHAMFVSPEREREQESHSLVDKTSSSSSTAKAERTKLGMSNRSTSDWQPAGLLCKRLGVEKPANASLMSENGKKLSTQPHREALEGDNDKSYTRSGTDSSHPRIDVPPECGTVIDADYENLLLEPVQEERLGLQDKARPSAELVRAIFNEPVPTTAFVPGSVKESSPSPVERNPRHKNRGVHKTRAVDFF